MAAPYHFRPLRLLSNPHLQTIIGSWIRGPGFPHSKRERHVTLDDGDCIVLQDSRPAGWTEGDRIALLLHGLGGTHRSGYMQRSARFLLADGVRVVRMDMRGCGRGAALARRTYHGGRSEDVRAALAEIRHWAPTSPLIMVGFSLGGNVVLKLAGEAVDQPVPGLERVVAVSPPIDLAHCCELIALPRNRAYQSHYVQSCIDQVHLHCRHFPDLPRVDFNGCRSMRGFDDLYTAPMWGFADSLDYYQRSAAIAFVPRISVPTLIITSRDDPFIAVESFESLTLPAHVELQITKHGGHLGFLGWDGDGGIRWAERRVADWLLK